MRVGIRTKFVLLVSLLLLIIFGAITVFQIRNNTKNLRSSLFEESRAFASLATQPIGNVFGIYKDSGTYKIDQQIDEFLKLNDRITNVAIVDITGKTQLSKVRDAKVSISAEQASTFEPIYLNNTAGALSTIIYPYFESSGAHRYSVVYTVSDKEVNKAVEHEAQSLLLFGLASLAATMLLIYALINRLIIKPVRQVSEQAGVISSGNLEQQIEVHGHDEIARLGQSVNKMAESLKEHIAQLKEVDKVKSEFMLITSHNLRTPLTIIDGYLDNMELVINDPEKLSNAFAKIGSSVKRLEVFAEDILTISRIELGNAELMAEPVKTGEFFERIVSDFRPTAELKNLTFNANIQDGDTELKISKPYIRSAVWNVLDNAAKFTKEGGTVSIDVKREGDSLVLSVSDTGIGISEEELKKLFTKFHRGTSTLTYDFEGTGIGLYASKVMIENHGGTIGATSQVGQGSMFTIKLPVYKPEAAQAA
jgi:signal transduction histidine kinase